MVNVTGQQFTWTFEYPGEKVKSTELVLPKDRPVEFRIQTKDVIHSFWVPEFRLKSDAVPGLTTKIRLTPDRIGRYQVVCAELCGIGHSAMRQNVRVVAAAAFQSWLDQQADGAAPGASGGGEPGGGGRAAAPPTARRSSPQRVRQLPHVGRGQRDRHGRSGPRPDLEARRCLHPRLDRRPEQGGRLGVQPRHHAQDFGEKLSPEELDALVEYLLKAQK